MFYSARIVTVDEAMEFLRLCPAKRLAQVIDPDTPLAEAAGFVRRRKVAGVFAPNDDVPLVLYWLYGSSREVSRFAYVSRVVVREQLFLKFYSIVDALTKTRALYGSIDKNNRASLKMARALGFTASVAEGSRIIVIHPKQSTKEV